jgi:hypothetical protein
MMCEPFTPLKQRSRAMIVREKRGKRKHRK